MIKIIDDFLPADIFLPIRYNLLTKARWKYFSGTATKNEEPRNFFFHYNLIRFEPNLVELLSQRINEIYPLDRKLNMTRCSSNLTVRAEYGYHTMAHIDECIPHYVLLMYINSSDGDTFIYDEKWDKDKPQILSEQERDRLPIAERISPKENRCVLFDGYYYHSYHFPKNNNRRIVINMNLS